MDFYHAPTSCSQATHIMLEELGDPYDAHVVDLRTGLLADGRPFSAVHAKGYVPALRLPDGQLLTESVAVLDWLTLRAGRLSADGFDRTRHLQWLAFLSTELHKPFVSWFTDEDPIRRAALEEILSRRLFWTASQLQGPWLISNAFTGADAFLYVIQRWSMMIGLELPESLAAHARRTEARASVARVLKVEGQTPLAA